MPQSTDIAIHAEPGLYGSAQDQFLMNEDDLSVAELIPQILHERKTFLNISEAGVAAEIEHGSASTTPGSPGAAGTSEGGTETETEDESVVEKFSKQKLELLAHIGSALNETSLSLDFVSLLMSAAKPAISKPTISPHLSKTAPLGSLSADRLKMDYAPAPGSHATAQSVGLGWKYQSLANVAAQFRSAHTQLREQTKVEKEYWRQITKVLAHDEVLYKLRDPANNARAIGVQYGYGDSGSTYHDKGRAVLRKSDETGDIAFCRLAPGSSSDHKPSHSGAKSRNRYVRVRILSKIDDDYMLTGQSATPRAELAQLGAGPEAGSVSRDIETARFFLFEDDLFFHLIREAKLLIGYHVTIIAEKVILDLRDRIVELEAVHFDADADAEDDAASLYQNTNEESSRDNAQAQDILNFLKIMLCCYYRYRLDMKQKMPTSFTKWKQANSHPLLLRPLLGHTRHQTHCRSVAALLQKLGAGLDSAVFSHTLAENMYATLDTDKMANPFAKAIQRPASTFTLVLEQRATQAHLQVAVEVSTTEIFVDLAVQLSVIKYTSKEEFENNQHGSNVLSLEYTDLADVAESLDWTVANFLEEQNA